MEPKANFALVGAFIIAVAAAAAGFAIWLANFDFSREYRDIDIVISGPARGLGENNAVQFNGMNVGEVLRVSFDPQAPERRVIARIRIDATTPVKKDTQARLELNPLTNVALIQLSGGTVAAGNLTGSGGVPKITARAPQLEALVADGQDLLQASKLAVDNFNEVTGADNAANLAKILANLENISAEVAANRKMIADARLAIVEARSAAEAVRDAALAAKDLATQSGTRLDNLTNTADKTLTAANAALASIDKAAQTVSIDVNAGAVAIEEASIEVDRAANDFNLMMETIKGNPAGFVSGALLPEKELPR